MAYLYRTLIAGIACWLAYQLIPPVARIIGLDLTSDIWLVIRLCIAGVAVFYIIRGPNLSWPSKPAA